MQITNVEINNQLFDFALDETHPLVANALGYMTEAELRNTIVRAMTSGGLTYENLEEMNAGGTWCIASKSVGVA